jgi:hypothetical protein
MIEDHGLLYDLYGKVTILVIYYLGEQMLKKTANT